MSLSVGFGGCFLRARVGVSSLRYLSLFVRKFYEDVEAMIQQVIQTNDVQNSNEPLNEAISKKAITSSYNSVSASPSAITSSTTILSNDQPIISYYGAHANARFVKHAKPHHNVINDSKLGADLFYQSRISPLAYLFTNQGQKRYDWLTSSSV